MEYSYKFRIYPNALEGFKGIGTYIDWVDCVYA